MNTESSSHMLMGGAAIGQALIHNNHLLKMDLSWNKLGKQSAADLSRCLLIELWNLNFEIWTCFTFYHFFLYHFCFYFVYFYINYFSCLLFFMSYIYFMYFIVLLCMMYYYIICVITYTIISYMYLLHILLHHSCLIYQIVYKLIYICII